MADDAVPTPEQAPPAKAPPPDQAAALDVVQILAALQNLYPHCFPSTGANPKPLKIGIHRDVAQRGGLPDGITDKALRGFFRWYTTCFRYRKVLAKGGSRVDLDGHPCGEITQEQAASAKLSLKPKDKARSLHPAPQPSTPPTQPLPVDTHLTEDNIVPGKLEVTIKFTELPKAVQVQGGYKFGLDCDGKPVVVVLKPKLWNKLVQAAAEYPQWVAALSGKMGEALGNGFVLEQPSLQVFERKPKGEGKAEAASETPPAASESPAAPAEAPTPALSTPTATVTAPAEKPVEPSARRLTLGLKKTEQDDVYPYQ